jgi:uncharacterized RDD family membrane protein YckC
MQQPPPQDPGPPQQQVEYAGLGMRFAAVVIDTVVVYFLVSLVWATVLVLRQPIDAQDPAAVQDLVEELQASMGTFYLVFFCSLFIYYPLLEALVGATIGKLLLGMRVMMSEGSRATGGAVVMRNLVRIPEALLLYVPAGISCLNSPRCQRLGDRAAHTIVVRRRSPRLTVVPGGPGQPAPYAQPPAPASPAPPPIVHGTPWPAPAETSPPQTQVEPPSVEAQLARLKTAALAARGAHLSYLRFSERELAGGGAEQSGGYSKEYVSAWFTLADAVAALKDAGAGLESAATAAGQTPREAAAGQPDLVHLLDELAPYFQAADDDAVHAAFLQVARSESSPA